MAYLDQIELPNGSEYVLQDTTTRGMIGSSYNSASTYNTGMLTIYNGKVYSANQDGITGSWNASKWTETTIAAEIYEDEVIANPSGSASTPLEKVKIKSTTYSVPSDLGDLTDVTLSSPATDQMLRYSGSIWENKTYRKELTKAEYDLLSTAEKNNGTIYFITDLPGGEGVVTLEDLSDVTITDPTANDMLQYNGTDWTNKQYKRELTKAEYDALPTAEKNNGIMYLITDDDIDWSPSCYSTSEMVVGSWVDGKTVYQKTYILSAVSIASGATQTLDTITNLNLLVKGEGSVTESNVQTALPDYELKIQKSGTTIQLRAGRAWSISSGAITVRYTKTA